MKFLTCTYTDVGTRKKTNQDSMLVMQAKSDAGPVLMASVCDGMGGLAKGEVASAAMVRALEDWFCTCLPSLLSDGFAFDKLQANWEELVKSTSRRIADYGAKLHVELGTTAVVLLIIGNAYYILNVGDSRIYLLSDTICQLTKDQTYVQREIDLGNMTPEQAATDSKKNVLLQCIGASSVIQPEFVSGSLATNQVYLICSDGFRHVVRPHEIYNEMNSKALRGQKDMEAAAKKLTELNMARGESDNISVILVRTKE